MLALGARCKAMDFLMTYGESLSDELEDLLKQHNL